MNMPDPIDLVMGLGICAVLAVLFCRRVPRGNCKKCDGLGYRMAGVDGCDRCGGTGNTDQDQGEDR